MMSGRLHLFVPGPTQIPDRILRAMHRPSEDHRSVAFPELVMPLLQDVARLVDTEQGRVALFTSSGTGGWEAALGNTLAPGTRVLLPCTGQFADLWGDAAARLGYTVERLPGMQWGDAPPPDRIAERLAADRQHEIAAVLIVHNETSTGVTADMPAIRVALDDAGHPALLMADGVSAIGSLEYHHDHWGVDVAITGSQKGLMLPAGLAVTAWSPRALQCVASSPAPRAYFDLRPMLAQNAQGYFPYTPSIPLLYGLRESLAMLFEEGLANVWARHERLARGVRAAVLAWDLDICCRDPVRASNTVTTVMLPDGVDGKALLAHAFTRYQLALGGGLGPLAGKAFRIGHLGDLNEGMLLGALALVEMVLRDLGVAIRPGSGVAAAEGLWAATT
jgi:alanine-glyoxylate transaminase / serine-glyoxylate transaminase / serine-pyruvate transaminase